jgi:hypothetical protein
MLTTPPGSVNHSSPDHRAAVPPFYTTTNGPLESPAPTCPRTAGMGPHTQVAPGSGRSWRSALDGMPCPRRSTPPGRAQPLAGAGAYPSPMPRSQGTAPAASRTKPIKFVRQSAHPPFGPHATCVVGEPEHADDRRHGQRPAMGPQDQRHRPGQAVGTWDAPSRVAQPRFPCATSERRGWRSAHACSKREG